MLVRWYWPYRPAAGFPDLFLYLRVWLDKRGRPEKYRAHFDTETPKILNLSLSYMWDVRKKFWRVSEKVGNWPSKRRSQVSEWKWSGWVKKDEILRFFLLKPIFGVCWCLTLYSTCQWPQLGHLAVSFVRLVQNACPWPVRLPTCEKPVSCWDRLSRNLLGPPKHT